MAAAQLAARPYGSFRSYRHDLYPYAGDMCGAPPLRQPSTIGYSSSTCIGQHASARQRPPIVLASQARAHVSATIRHHPITMQSQLQPHPPKSGRTNPAETVGAKKIVILGNNAFKRNSHATASWDGTLRSNAFATSSSNSTQYRRTAATSSASQHPAMGSLRGSGKFVTTNNGTGTVTCLAHRSPQCSSAGTSVESIVPKYTLSSTAAAASGASQKRSYNQHKPLKEPATSKKQPINFSTYCTASPGSGTSNNTTSSSTFSSKFPAGLPFEHEFYQPAATNGAPAHRSNSIASEASKYSGCSAYDNHQQEQRSGRVRPLPFEDEFMRKPSNEPLYVDFSKEIPRVRPDRRASDSPVTPPPPSTTMMASLAKSRHYFGREQRPMLRAERFRAADDGVDKSSKILVNNKAVPTHRVADSREPLIVVAIASWNCSRLPATNGIENANESSSLVSNRLKLYVSAETSVRLCRLRATRASSADVDSH